MKGKSDEKISCGINWGVVSAWFQFKGSRKRLCPTKFQITLSSVGFHLWCPNQTFNALNNASLRSLQLSFDRRNKSLLTSMRAKKAVLPQYCRLSERRSSSYEQTINKRYGILKLDWVPSTSSARTIHHMNWNQSTRQRRPRKYELYMTTFDQT